MKQERTDTVDYEQLLEDYKLKLHDLEVETLEKIQKLAKLNSEKELKELMQKLANE